MENERCIFCENIIKHQNDDCACDSCLEDIHRPSDRKTFVGTIILVLVLVLLATFS